LHPPSKGQDLLLAVLRLPEWLDRPIHVSFFGEGPHEQMLRRLVQNYGLQEKVSFRGHVSDVAQIWRENHALVLPSRYEGLPLAVVEALLCGRPVIVTDVAGNAEVVEDGVTGFVAESPKVIHLACALERAWSVRDQWHEMGKRAQISINQVVPEDAGAIFANMLISLM
jgi:glycosyltransferase involved in cell wall biosynthesis